MGIIMRGRKCYTGKVRDKSGVLFDTLTFSNIDWTNSTLIFDHTNSSGDANQWIAPDNGVVNVFVQSNGASALEVYLYVNSVTHYLYSFSQKSGWADVLTFYVKKGQSYRIHTQGEGNTVYANKAYFYPLINPIR